MSQQPSCFYESQNYRLPFPVSIGAQYVATAQPCAPGYYSLNGQAPCVPAPPGYYVPTSGATSRRPFRITNDSRFVILSHLQPPYRIYALPS
jgi:hypothetical protein